MQQSSRRLSRADAPSPKVHGPLPGPSICRSGAENAAGTSALRVLGLDMHLDLPRPKNSGWHPTPISPTNRAYHQQTVGLHASRCIDRPLSPLIAMWALHTARISTFQRECDQVDVMSWAWEMLHLLMREERGRLRPGWSLGARLVNHGEPDGCRFRLALFWGRQSARALSGDHASLPQSGWLFELSWPS